MSLARYDVDEQSVGTGQRCTLDHARKARKHYGSRARDPAHPDELGALAVVDLMDCGDQSHDVCGGRLAFFRVAGVDECEIRRLPRRP